MTHFEEPISNVPRYSQDMKDTESVEIEEQETVDESDERNRLGSEFVVVANSNPALDTVGIVDYRFRRTKRESRDIITFHPVHTGESIHDHEIEFAEKRSKTQVRFTESNMALRSLERLGEIQGYKGPSEHIFPIVNSLTLVREKPSSKRAEIVSVSENIISLDSENITVKTPKDDISQIWEVESGFAIFKLIHPIPYSPSASNTELPNEHLNRKRHVLFPKEKYDVCFRPKCCMEFASPVEFSKLFVTNTINQAKETYLSLLWQYGDPDKKPCRKVRPAKLARHSWSNIKELTKDEGLCLIEKFIVQNNSFKEDWKYSIWFEGVQSDRSSEYLFYVANFSLPTNIYPIPQVTVNLYFQLDVSRVIPPICPIKVTFRVEGSHLKLNPDRFVLHDNLLCRVLDIKLKTIKNCNM